MSILTDLEDGFILTDELPPEWPNDVATLLKLYLMQALPELAGSDGFFSATDFNVSGTTPSNLQISAGRGFFGPTGSREFARNSGSQNIATLANGTHSIYVDENGIYQTASGAKTHKAAEVVITAGALTSINNLPTGRVNLGTLVKTGDAAYISLLTAPQWTKYTKSYSDLAAASGSNDIELFSLSAKRVIHAVIIKHTTAFGGGAIATYTVSVGVAGNLTKYAGAFNVFQAVANTTFQQTSTLGMENFGAATSIRLAAVATGANLNAATAGSVDIFVLSSLLP